jgi:uncharacterized protein YdiU (UPF0061 family)
MKNDVTEWINSNEDLSMINSLNKDPESDKFYPNQSSRSVKSGHYVLVKPTPLRDPYLVAYSLPLAQTLQLDAKMCQSDAFLSVFSGNEFRMNSDPVRGNYNDCWATPYALSIYGTEIYDNCPFKNDTGYGDGRAMSLTEVIIDNKRWELQLKGSGKTPFCRTGDGRAVLRSSVREFLASEAMFHLGIPTTRALSLIASNTDVVARPWFSCPKQQFINKTHDIIQQTKCSILCRTASSFIRVGHIELFNRRARDSHIGNNGSDMNKQKELELMVNHTIFREYGYLNELPMTFQEKMVFMLNNASHRFANLIANWLRVGYVQGNFNSDNCHVGGLTMDYGPFGFMEKFNILWNPWINGGKQYAFLNQVYASDKNFDSLVNAVLPLLDEQGVAKAERIRANYLELVINKCNLMWSEKLGFTEFDETVSALKYDLFELMEQTEADFTLLWRQLCYIVENDPTDDKLYDFIDFCFYKELTDKEKGNWTSWLKLWLTEIKKSGRDMNDVAKHMKLVSPKFVPRESMLVSAYEAADKGDYSVINELQTLFETPYDEHIDDGMSNKYYMKPKEASACSVSKGNSFIS